MLGLGNQGSASALFALKTLYRLVILHGGKMFRTNDSGVTHKDKNESEKG